MTKKINRKPIKEFTVNRKTWIRGDNLNSYLLRSDDNKMCCLGFFCLASGLTEDQIRNITEPNALFQHELNKLPEHFSDINYYESVVEINDLPENKFSQYFGEPFFHPLAIEPKREQALTEQFALLGIKINFTG